MKENHHFFYLSLFFSLLLHLSLFYTVIWNHSFLKASAYRPRAMVPVQVVRQPAKAPPKKMTFDLPEPPPDMAPIPVPAAKPKVKKALKPKQVKKAAVKPAPKTDAAKKLSHKPLPPSNNPKAKNPPSDADNIKPVFGVNQDSITESGQSGMAVRVGNTLMKAQEETFTPPEEVQSYAVTPSFELSAMPEYKSRVSPEYPDALKRKGVEGEVLLTATIDKNGNVVKVEVKRSDNELFSKAAAAALKQCTFSPGMQNGKPVATTIDIPIKFLLNE